MRKYALAFSLVVCVIAVVAAAYTLFAGREVVRALGPEAALPRVAEGEEYVLAVSQRPGEIAELLSTLGEALPGLPRWSDAPWAGLLDLPDPLAGPRALYRRAKSLHGVLAVADACAYLAVSPDVPGGCFLAFRTADERVEALVQSPDALLFGAEPWQSPDAEQGERGWVVRRPLFSRDGADVFYAVCLRRGDAALMLVSDAPDGVERMRRALAHADARVRIQRKGEGGDFLQAVRILAVGGETRPALLEIARVEAEVSERGVRADRFRIYSDFFPLAADGTVPSSGLYGGELPPLGRGEVGLAAGCDIPFLCFALFPGDPDPIGRALARLDRVLPAPLRGELRGVMERGRVSGAVVLAPENGETQNAYLVVESEATASLNRIFSLAALFLKRADVAGWDDFRYLSAGGGARFVAARAGSRLLLGSGRPEDYGVEAAVPAELRDAQIVRAPAFAAATGDLLRARGLPLPGDGRRPLRAISFRMEAPDRAELLIQRRDAN